MFKDKDELKRIKNEFELFAKVNNEYINKL